MTTINANLIIEEPEGGIRFGTDALLLAGFMLPRAGKKGLDLGTGSGVISLLYLSCDKRAEITGIEIQSSFASAASRNAEANGMKERFRVINGDLRASQKLFANGAFDFVFSNPPYYKVGSGIRSETSRRDDAFRENECTIDDLLGAAAWSLKYGGKFFAVYRPERAVALLAGMRQHGIEPKRIRFVCPDASEKPSLLLAEGRREGGEGLTVMKNLYVYSDETHKSYSPEMNDLFASF